MLETVSSHLKPNIPRIWQAVIAQFVIGQFVIGQFVIGQFVIGQLVIGQFNKLFYDNCRNSRALIG